MNVGAVIQAEKKGKLDFRVDKNGIVHAIIGKKSMGAESLKDNYAAFMGAIMKAKPSSSKGVYLQGITMSSTMGPGVKVELSSAEA